MFSFGFFLMINYAQVRNNTAERSMKVKVMYYMYES